MNDGNAQNAMKTYRDLKLEAKREGYSGDAMYDYMIQRAIDKISLEGMACFVGCTLVRLCVWQMKQ